VLDIIIQPTDHGTVLTLRDHQPSHGEWQNRHKVNASLELFLRMHGRSVVSLCAGHDQDSKVR